MHAINEILLTDSSTCPCKIIFGPVPVRVAVPPIFEAYADR